MLEHQEVWKVYPKVLPALPVVALIHAKAVAVSAIQLILCSIILVVCCIHDGFDFTGQHWSR
jgi:hypothetical protein